MSLLLRLAAAVSLWLAIAGGAILFLSAFVVTFDVLARKLLNYSIGGADELSGYALGIATTFGLAHALLRRAHIRIDVLYNKLAPRFRIACDLLGLALLTGFGMVVAWLAWGLVADTFEHGSRSITPLRTPLALPQVPWLIGWLWFVGVGILLLAAMARHLLRGDRDAAGEMFSVRAEE